MSYRSALLIPVLAASVASFAFAEDEPKKKGVGEKVVDGLNDTADKIDGAVKDVAGDGVTASKSELVLDGNMKTLTAKCDHPKKRVKISGNQHTVVLTGECFHVSVDGNGHSVTLETVTSIEVSGTNNQIMYKSGPGKKAPKIKSSGINNKVSKLEPAP